MNVDEIQGTWKKLGKPQTAAIYKRHGAGDNVFGVLTSEIAKVKKKIKVDHALAAQLWKTGNAESRVLALQIADPEKLTSREADAFVRDTRSRFFSCYLADLVARSRIAEQKMREWMSSRDEFARETGYGILGCRLKNAPESIGDADAERVMATIEKEIHGSPNLARHAMNGALIAIGTFKPSLRREAVATAKRIGEVEVDHGETNCKTPDAASAIEKESKRKRCP